MLNTLRRRFILSHALPLLLIIPLMGIALVYVLETQVLLPNLYNEAKEEAMLIAETAADHPGIWYDPAQAQAFVTRVEPYLKDRVMLLDPRGHLLASSDSDDVERLGQSLEIPGLAEALAGKVSGRTFYSQRLREETVDVLVPVVGPDQHVAGVIRLTYRLASIYEQFLRLRSFIAGVLAVGLLLGAAVGWVLALNLERPLQQVTQAIYRLASGQQLTPLPEQGPEEIRLLSQAVNTLVGRLQTLERARRQLLANLVHELGRPLGALHSAIQALQSGADEDVALRQELLMGMEAEVHRLERLLDDLTHLHDRVLGTLELICQPTALSNWLPGVLVTWREAAQAKRLHWEATVPTDLPTLEVDPDRLAQALGNLLSNAIKYTSPGGTVSVGAGVKDGAVWIRVSDTGLGIPPEEQAQIFTPFYRGYRGRRFPQGMGLGLNITRDLVAAHGGRLELESTPGLGSHFTIWLPSKPDER
jgi:two-component system sensor histidine kinase BaeS